jgi:hypothetical protein
LILQLALEGKPPLDRDDRELLANGGEEAPAQRIGDPRQDADERDAAVEVGLADPIRRAAAARRCNARRDRRVVQRVRVVQMHEPHRAGVLARERSRTCLCGSDSRFSSRSRVAGRRERDSYP